MDRVLLALLLTLLFSGCASDRVDWQARVGTYTQDRAITEFGPPDKSDRLSDGTIVDEWITNHAHTINAPEPYFLPPGAYVGPATPTYSETYVPNYYLQLTFGPDGKLKAWKEFAR